MSIRNENHDSEFWRKRAENYNRLEWANNPLYVDEFIRMGEFKKTDIVLDIGPAGVRLNRKKELIWI